MAKKKKNDISIRTQLAVATGIVCLLVLFGCFVAWLDYGTKKSSTIRTYPDVTIRGKVVCLPHSQSAGTEECTSGILTATGIYYAIDGTVDRSKDGTIEVTGTLLPPSRHDGYAANGTLQVR